MTVRLRDTGPRSQPPPAGNLPVELTSFVGRAAELADVGRLLAAARLLTLIGPGGSGKTRLAVRAAVGAGTEGHPDGVWFIDLGPADDSDLVAGVVAAALGVLDADGPADQRVARHLARLDALLVLDTCEHVVEGCAALVDLLLRSCPTLRILATSRTPLEAPGEVTWPVPPMALVPTTAGAPGVSEAGRLFVERASLLQPGFDLNPVNAAAVAEICRRLDGIPLAIELAAARIRVLSLEQIGSGLDEVFKLLGRGARTAVARQQTLRASVDWSHDLLSEPERMLFRRLAAFPGSFDYAAAQAVGAAEGLAAHQVLDQLDLLVAKSLVLAIDSGGPVPALPARRYRMLDSIRQYAAERLADADEDRPTLLRHRDHFLTLAESVGTGAAADQDRGLDVLELEIDNLRTAFAWSRRCGDTTAALRLATALSPLWHMRGRRAEGRSWFDAALKDVAADPSHAGAAPLPPALHAEAAIARCRIEGPAGDAGAVDRIDDAVALARRSGDRRLLARALVAGTAYGRRGPERWRAHLQEGIELASELGEVRLLLNGQVMLASLEIASGQPTAAVELYERAEPLAEQLGDQYRLRTIGTTSSLALLMQGDATGAERRAREAAESSREVGDRTYVAAALGVLSWARALLGRTQAAADAGAEALRLMAENPDVGYHESLVWLCTGVAALVAGEPDLARERLRYGWSLTADTPGFADLFAGPWADADLAAGDLNAARRRTDAAIRTGWGRFGWQLGWALAARARVAVVDGEPGQAEDLAHRALAIRRDVHDRLGVAETFELLAGLAARDGDGPEAARLFGAAAALWDVTGCRRLGVHQPNHEATVELVRETMGEATFRPAFNEGASLSLHATIAWATRGRGRHTGHSSGWAGLTPAEVEVVRLVTEGLSNKEIGARLFISPRTVQSHLTHVYVKVGVTSRLQLAREAARRG